MSISDRYLRAARSSTQLNAYHPALAQEMRQQGLQSYGELWNKIKPYIDAHPHFFAGVSYQSVNNCVHGKEIMLASTNDYSSSAYAIAAGLDKSVEELFGELVLLEPNIRNTAKSFKGLEVLGDGYEDRTYGPIVEVSRRELSAFFKKTFDGLEQNRRDCLAKRYGLEGPEQTFESIAQEWRGEAVTKERAMQIAAKALKKLRRPEIARTLRPFLDNF